MTTLVRRMRFLLLAAPLFALLSAGCARLPDRVQDAASPYFDAKTLDLSRLLPPAPTDDSAITRSEIELMLKIQQERTPEEAARARADASYSVFRFADALGNPDVFNGKTLPRTSSL